MKRRVTTAESIRGPLSAARKRATAVRESARNKDLNKFVSLFDFAPEAKRRISHMAWEYFDSGAADEITLRWNREAYDRLRLRPKVLVDVSKIDTRVSLLGQELSYPILLAPAADQRMVHPDGEKATARGAGSADAIFVVSSFTNTEIEEVAKNANAPLWFQIYVQRDRAFTLDVVQRVQAAGCKALCVTVDSPTFGARNRLARAKYELRPGLRRPHLPPPAKANGDLDLGRGTLQVYHDWVEPALTWRDISWLSSNCRIPVLVKGVLNPDDADRAVQEGVSGIIVSNHGARNLDTLPATVDALPHVVEKVAGRVPVLVDGGIRRGTDVVKALALGANAVLIGRPYLYGLAAAGDKGVKRVVDILRNELEMAMGLLGRPTIQSIDRSVLWS